MCRTSSNAVIVTIARSPCSVQTINRTHITCATGSYQYRSIRASIKVFINGSGYAVGSVDFQYIDLWSSPWTWDGQEPPEAATLVVIDSYVTVYLDIKTPILTVLVIDNATLIFDDSQDVALNVEYIVIVNGGQLQVGTGLNPFQHRGIITMHGHLRSIELPIYGAKVLALRDGIVDMHGTPTIRTWTQLGVTALNGSSTITLVQPVDWAIDSQIVIATTGDRFSQKESEVRRITNISSDGLLTNPNNIVELNAVAGTTHYGYWYRLGDKPEGLSLAKNSDYCPNRQPLGSFYNNSVHSTGRFGVWVYPEYAPTIMGNCSGLYPMKATFDGLTSWKNNRGIEIVMSRTIQIKNAVVFDNADFGIGYITAFDHQTTNPLHLRTAFYDVDNGSVISDSVIVGDAGISSDPIVPITAGLVGK
ncbi:unnamed protein product [Rotaria sp. Silwood2]|nr:unnamed protein product [Rotaria sp. Silwood2]